MSTTYNSHRLQPARESRRVPGLAFSRMFSQAGIEVLDAVRWERRVLARNLPEVEVPAQWSNEAALEFLRARGVAGAGTETARKPQSVRVEMERLLTELRGAALRGGYFARPEDAEIFAEEVGALLLSRRAVMRAPILLTRTPGSSREAWRWDAARGACVRETKADGTTGHGAAGLAQRGMTLDDPDLEALLAGREMEGSRLLAITDELMRAAEADGDVSSTTAMEPEELDQQAARSPASELLECIAAAVLERGTLDLLFAATARRMAPPLAEEAEPEAASMVAAGVAELDLLAFFTADKLLDLPALRRAAALLVTALEMGVDGRIYPEERLAVLAHNERRLAIGAVHLKDVLDGADVALDSEAAAVIAAGVAAVLSGEGLWQSARIAETCPAIRAAVASERSRRVDDALEQNATQAGGGACPAFRAHPERLLSRLRAQRAEAHRLGAPERQNAGTGGVIPIRADAAGAAGEQQPTSALVRQLPELLACAREVWDGALMEAERFGLRQCGVTGRWRAGDGVGSQDSSEADLATSELAIETATTQVRLLTACQPFADLPLPCSFDLPLDTSAAQLAEVILLAWRSGLPGISLLQRERGTGAFGPVDNEGVKVETVQSEGRVEESTADAPARPARQTGTDTASSTEPHLPEAVVEVSATRVETGTAGASLEGMTLAEAERAAVARGHATLVETQLHRISELEEQLKVIQARARENGETHDAQEPPRSMRHRLPAERASVTHAFMVAGHEGYVTVGLYPNGSPGEIFLRMTKEGSAVSGLLDSFATAVSLALQHGVPVRALAEQFAEMRFEPSGATANDQIPYALSIMDYLFRWIELRFLSGHQMDLFANLAPSPEQANAVRVTGTISGPKSSVVPNLTGRRSGGSS